ncbi:MAG: DUF1822 family protein [Cyanobacteriota bacterium]|nr:DUF1822 family protein [Cyanobacteriota bacterium]
MNNFTSDLTNDLFEIENNLEIINLEEQLQQAFLISEQINNQLRQWQVYFQCLALFAFEEWMQEREPSLTINKENSSTLQYQYANIIDAVCNLRIGNFKVCLIPSLLLTNEEIAIPRAVIDIPEYVAHFYVVVGVDEELEIAAVKGLLRYDQLINIKAELQPEADWNYYIYLAQFNQKVDDLLLYLQCLTPTAILLPEIPTSRQDILRRVQASLLNLLPQLNNRPLWKVLTWEQGKAVLTTPIIINWLYQSINQNAATLNKHLSDLLQILTQQAVNVSQWLVNQVDDAVQTLSWQLIPVSQLRSTLESNESNPIEELEAILNDIQDNNQLDIPSTSVHIYQDIRLDKSLRLYAIIWSLPEEENGWTLLLILKAVNDNQSASRFTLRVSDQIEVLDEAEFITDDNSYIYTQIEGSYDDKFLATVISESGDTQVFPPFEFIRQ